jgi:hypothetical protein
VLQSKHGFLALESGFAIPPHETSTLDTCVYKIYDTYVERIYQLMSVCVCVWSRARLNKCNQSALTGIDIGLHVNHLWAGRQDQDPKVIYSNPSLGKTTYGSISTQQNQHQRFLT